MLEESQCSGSQDVAHLSAGGEHRERGKEWEGEGEKEGERERGYLHAAGRSWTALDGLGRERGEG